MNVFLDTTVLFNDPFLKSYFNRLILDMAARGDVKLYLSNVVLLEARNHYSRNLSKSITELKKAIREYNKISKQRQLAPHLTDKVDDYIAEFDDFYSQLEKDGLIEILDYDNAFLPILVQRSIDRVKPFTENKHEFRDCIIWLTYCGIVKDRKLGDCFLVTDNTRDYYNKEGTDLHPDLKKDCSGFKVYRGIKNLILSEAALLDLKAEIEVSRWVSQENINNDYVLGLINRELFNDFYDVVQEFISDKLEPADFQDYCDVGFVELWGTDFKNVDDLEVKVIADDIVITGKVEADCGVEVYVYNPVADPDEDKYMHVGSSECRLLLDFSFTYNTQRVAGNVEVEVTGFLELYD